MKSLPASVRTRLQMDGPYDEAFLEKIQKCPAEDDGSVEYAVAKVSRSPCRSRAVTPEPFRLKVLSVKK